MISVNNVSEITPQSLVADMVGREIGDIYDFMYMLQAAKPGETATVVVVRDGERIELTVVYGERRRR